MSPGRRHLLVLFVATASCVAPSGGGDASILRESLATDVAWLADDAREGRRAGTEGGAVAGLWIAERMRALGLQPAGDAGAYEQSFSVPLEPRTTGRSFVAAPGGARIAEEATRLAPLFCAQTGTVTAPVVWCGYGVELASAGWDDFAGKDLAGKIALVVRGAPLEAPRPAGDGAIQSPHGDPHAAPANPHADPHATPPTNPHGGAPAKPADPAAAGTNPHGDAKLVTAGDPFANAALVFTKVMNAKRRGAVGVILVQHPSDAGKPVLAFHEGGSGRAGIPCVSLAWNDARALFGEASSAWMVDLESKPARSDAADARAFTLAAEVERGHGAATNVLGVVAGVDHSRVVVIGGHYDHLGWGGTGSLAPGQRAVHNGADDNASGTAVVLEVARRLAAGPKPPCDVLVALWSGEELGLLGSEHWAEHPTVPFERVVAKINLDMVGRAGNGKLQVLGAGSAVEFAPWLADAGPRARLDLAVNASASAMAGSSDHATFAKRKKPVLHLFSGLHTDYHKPTDDVERFEVEGAARVADLAHDLVLRAASAPTLAFVEPPPAPEGEERRMRGGFNAWFGSVPNYAFEGPGVKIDGTSPGSPAERAGFLAGDVLLAIGEVELESVYDLTYALQFYKPGDVVLVRYARDGARDETRVTLSSRGVR